jgi:NAD(P)-dependent dehydrogenase (short-subunit alcohol dehydrogenase family)
MTQQIVLVTGAASDFGRLSANALAHSRHIVYASMNDMHGRNAAKFADARSYARREGVELRAIEMDVCSQISVDAGIARIVQQHGRIDAIVHSSEHTAFGPAEAFTPEQFAELFDLGVLSAQRVNRAALPHMRTEGKGLLVWISSSSYAGGTSAYLAPYFVAKAGMDALAVQYALELSRWGIETSIIVPGTFASATNRFALSASPADMARAADYGAGPYAGFSELTRESIEGTVSADADPGRVAGAVVSVVDAPWGERPFRVHVNPSSDGAEIAFPVVDRVRDEMLRRLGFGDLLKPRLSKSNGAG